LKPSTETSAVRWSPTGKPVGRNPEQELPTKAGARVEGTEPESSTTREKRQAEAEILHRILFGSDAPAEVKQRYALALETLPLAAAPQCDLAALSERQVDLEAMELALRRNNPSNFLTQRFRVLCYLVETQPDYFHRFVNDRPRFLAGAITLGLMTLRAAYKALKGRWLVKRYDLG